jgi:RHS repeat-associated protein
VARARANERSFTLLRRLVAATTLAVIAVAAAAQAPASAAPPAAPRDHHLPAAQGVALVPAHPLPPGVAPAAPGAPAVSSVPAPTWPAAGTADVALPAATASRVASAARPSAPPLARAGGLPVQVGSSSASRVRVQVLGHAAAQQAGATGFLFRVDRADGGGQPAPVTARLDYTGFAQAYGGGFASRLTVVALPSCAATTPQLPACQVATPVPTANDLAARTLTVQLTAQPAATTPTSTLRAAASGSRSVGGTAVLAVTSTTSGGTGDYKATSLTPSGTWQVGLQTGDFTWQYPLRVPPPIGGAAPAVSLAYDSGSTDGETAQTNTQPSQVGEGFDLTGGGFVERKYKACADEITTLADKTGDLCWGGDNAFLSMDGRASELVKDDSSGTWRLKNDDGSRVELLTGASNGAYQGQYWRVTTDDGTQYFFGRNQLPGYVSGDQVTDSAWTVPVVGLNSGDPCHGSTYAASMCYQAWRWNLDLVIDPNGNATEYFYTPETNYYLFDSTGATPGTAKVYTRSGFLNEIGYSSQSSNVYAHIPMRVKFGYAGRCLSGSSCSTHTVQYWPDTPWDLSCSGSGCGATGHEAPSFWTQNMLTGVTTQVWEGSAGYVNVDSWSLGHQFLSAETDDLWLSSITHTGQVGGSQALPAVSISGTSFANRVSGDGYPAMYKYRVTAIHSESGQQTAVTYDPADCGSSRPSPSTDTLPCFEQWWTPGDPQLNEAPVDSWFYKYRPHQVTVHDDTNASFDDQLFTYTYLGGTAWHYDNDDGLVPNKYKSYSQWRGYEHVSVVAGSPTETQNETDHTFMRGMDGDHLPDGSTRSVSITDSQGTSISDSERLNGFTREVITYNGPGGAEVGGTIKDPWLSSATANSVKSWGTLTAKLEGVAAVHDRTDLASGGYRRTETDNTFDGQGLITQTSDLGDLSTSADDLCTTNTYAQNTSTWMLDYVDEQTVRDAACGSSSALVSDTRQLFDGGAFGAAPVHGNVTEADEWSAGDPGVTDHWVAASRHTYDSYGRVTSSKDAAGNTTSTAYGSAYGTGNATTQTVVTNPLGFASTIDLDPAWGLPVDTIDPNSQRTDLTYDPLGRLTAAWLPGQSKASGAKANATFTYKVSNTQPSAVTTNELINPNGLYVTSVSILDGLLRSRQSQRVAEAVDGAMLVTDTLYDSRGNVVTQNNPYPVTGTPSATLYGVSQSQVPSYTVTTYDGAGRKTADALYSMGTFQWQTAYSYDGDRTTEVPPQGDTVTTTITDARGRTAELDQYQSGSPSGAYDATRYSYTPAGQLAALTDPAGNRWPSVYDLLGRRIQATDPDAGTTTSTYDDLGHLISSTDARGKTVSYTYDVLGRKIAEYDTTGGAAPSSSDQLAAWTYDTVAGGKGQLASSTRHANGSAYSDTITGYDAAYHVTGHQVTIPAAEGMLAGTYTFGARYNVDGTLASESYPAAGGLAAETVNHMYDSLGQPDSTWGASDYVERTLWTPDMLPATYDLGLSQNSLWSAMNLSYDVATRRLAELTVQRESNNWTNDADVRYGYDKAGDVTSAAETVAGDYQCFTYDYVRRLTQAWAQGTSGCSTAPTAATLGGPSPYLEQLAYDLTGNRTSDTITYGPNNQVGYTNFYPAAGQPQPHTLTSQNVTSTAYGYWTDTRTYDAAGNTTTVNTPNTNQTLSWDDQGELASVVDTANNHTTTYVYDGGGSLLLRHDDASATLYLPGEELTASGTTVTATRYYSHNGTTVAVRNASGVHWFVPDPHGTDTVAIDASSQAVTQRRFTPFGSQRWPLPSSWPGDRGFVGGTVDTTTGFTNLGAREYDPVSGRFLSADPLLDPADPQQLNAYAYARNNPVTDSDPSGLHVPNDAGCVNGYHCGSSIPHNSSSDDIQTWEYDSGNSGPSYILVDFASQPHHKRPPSSPGGLATWVGGILRSIPGAASSGFANGVCNVFARGVSFFCVAAPGMIGGAVGYTTGSRQGFDWRKLVTNGISSWPLWEAFHWFMQLGEELFGGAGLGAFRAATQRTLARWATLRTVVPWSMKDWEEYRMQLPWWRRAEYWAGRTARRFTSWLGRTASTVGSALLAGSRAILSGTVDPIPLVIPTSILPKLNHNVAAGEI